MTKYNYDNCIEGLSPFELNDLKSKIHIILDDGHGWLTEGKRSQDGSFRENEFNSVVMYKLAFILYELGITYNLLAPEWDDVSLEERVKRERIIYNNINKTKQCIGLSIHCDAFTDSNANGFTVFYFTESTKSKLLATSISSAIADSNFTYSYLLKNRGVKNATFYMLKNTYSLFVLIESGFMTNSFDLAYLKKDDFKNNFAKALLYGLINFSVTNM